MCVTAIPRRAMDMGALWSPELAGALCRAPFWEPVFYSSLPVAKSISLCQDLCAVRALAHTCHHAKAGNVSYGLHRSRIIIL